MDGYTGNVFNDWDDARLALLLPFTNEDVNWVLGFGNEKVGSGFYQVQLM